MITRDARGSGADHRCNCVIPALQLLHTTCGTPNYVAPEVLNDKGYDGRAADVWSAGVILYVLLAGFLPFDEPHMSALFRKIQKAEFTYPSWFTPPVRALLDRILIPDPARRATISDLEKDPWFLGSDNGAGYLASAFASVAAAAAPAETVRGSPAAGGTPLAHVPSAKDIDEAVEDVDDDAEAGRDGAAVAGGAGAAAAPRKDKAEGGPRTLNAFDVVNMFGGLALNRLLEATDKRVLAVTPQFLSAMPVGTIMTRIQVCDGLASSPLGRAHLLASVT